MLMDGTLHHARIPKMDGTHNIMSYVHDAVYRLFFRGIIYSTVIPEIIKRMHDRSKGTLNE